MVKMMSGGGITSNKYVTSKGGQKVEPKAQSISPAGVAQQGMATQFRKEPLEQGKGYEPKPMPATGSRGTYSAAAQGPGSGRTTYKAGSQGACPAEREMPKGREILGSFGPEISGPSRRR